MSSSSESILDDHRTAITGDLSTENSTRLRDLLRDQIKGGGFTALDNFYYNETGLRFSSSDESSIKTALDDIFGDIMVGDWNSDYDSAQSSSLGIWQEPAEGNYTGIQDYGTPYVSLSLGPITLKPGKSASDYRSDLINGAFSMINKSNNWNPTLTIVGDKFRLILGDVSSKFSSTMDANSFSAPNETIWGAALEIGGLFKP